MRNGKMKKSFAMLIAGAMLSGMLTGCGGQGDVPVVDSSKGSVSVAGGAATDGNAEIGEITYPVADGGSFTYGLALDSAWSDRYNSYDELPLGKALEEATGYDMEMIHVADKTAMNLLLASGELPDAITYNFATNYTGGDAKALKDGLTYPMTEEFVKENAPDYWKYLNENPDVLKQVKSSDGYIYGFAFILGGELLKGGYGLIVRDDWCEELNLELPETAEDYYNMLKAFKEQKGVEIPLCVSSSELGGMMEKGCITSPFGLVSMDSYVDNGIVEIGYAQPEFKDMLEWLNKLYADGLLDPNFATVDKETITANMLTGKSGASAGACGSILGTWLTTNKDVENYSLAGIQNLVANAGDTPMYGHYNNDVPGNMTVISSSCKDPAKVARFFNYGYTEEGDMLYNFGTEGVSYELVDGEPIFTDLILNNPDGLTLKQALSEYQRAWTNGPFVQDPGYLLQYYSDDRQKAALEIWCDNDARKYKLPKITIPEDEASEYSSLVSEMKTYRDEMIIKFIRGEESLDNYDRYLSNLQSMGIDRLQEILQAAYEVYNAK